MRPAYPGFQETLDQSLADSSCVQTLMAQPVPGTSETDHAKQNGVRERDRLRTTVSEGKTVPQPCVNGDEVTTDWRVANLPIVIPTRANRVSDLHISL